MGTNDLSINKALGDADSIDYNTLLTAQPDGTYPTPANFAEAYALMLHKISVRYPDAEVYCLSLLQRNEADVTVEKQNEIPKYNAVINSVAAHFEAIYVDQYNDSGITSNSANATFYMHDTLHPNEAGMDAMTGSFVSALLKNSRYSTVRDNLYQVSYDLGNVLPEEGTMKTAVAGAPFTMPICNHNDCNYIICVTMDGTDVTDLYFNRSTNAVEIPAVTGDIVISASTKDVAISCDGTHEGWTALTGNTISESGNYYLTEDLTAGIVAAPGVTATLCLCGHTVITQDTALLISAPDATEKNAVTLLNCKSEGGTLTRTAAGGRTIEVYANSTLDMGENIHVDNSTADGAVYLKGQAVFNMYAGTISNNQSSQHGAVELEGTSTFNLYGGSIDRNTATVNGGGVCVNGGTFHLYGGLISGNTAVSGGGVYVNGGTFTMDNGTISGNTATGSGKSTFGGGGVYVYSGMFNLKGGNITGNAVTGKAATGSSAHVASSGDLAMTGGTISDLYTLSSKEATVSGGTVNGTTISVYDAAKAWSKDTNNDDDTMLADMIAYGVEAQKLFDYKTTETNNELTAGTQTTPNWKRNYDHGVTEGFGNKVRVSLTLEDQIQLNIYILDSNPQIETVSLTDGTTSRTLVVGTDYVKADVTAGTRLSFGNISIKDAKKAVSFTVTLSDNTQFDVNYGISDYIIQEAQNADSEQIDLMQALMKYVDSTSAYLNRSGVGVKPGEDETNPIIP